MSGVVSATTLEKMREAAKSLVIRSRSGDQCAIAMIMRIRQMAPHSRRAAVAYDLLRDYVHNHPVKSFATFGLVDSNPMERVYECAKKENWNKLVKAIESLPKDIDVFAKAACLVADGGTVNVDVLRAVLPHLRGDVVIDNGKVITLGEAHRAGKKIAETWRIESNDGNLRITPEDGLDIGFRSGSYGEGKASSSSKMFAFALKYSVFSDMVQKRALKFRSVARQPYRIGYVLGLAKVIQDVRDGASLSNLSDLAAWELGEDNNG
jgi:hypothetical protein